MSKMEGAVRYCMPLELRRSLARHILGFSEIVMAVIVVVMRLVLSEELQMPGGGFSS